MGTSLDNPLLKLLGRTFERLEKDVLKDIERLEKDVLKYIDNKTTFVLGQVNKDKSSLEQRLVSEIGQVNKDKSSLEQRLVLERKVLTDIIGRTERLEKDVLNIDNKTTFVLGQVNKDNSSLEQRLVSERRELIDIICQLHPCTEWEAWTSCSANKKETFDAQTRSRTCGVKASKLCSSTVAEQKEADTRICEGDCPTNYTKTTNGYCMIVHHDIIADWTTAQALCKQEGGYLMNIDSQLKALDVNNTLSAISHRSNFWINGTRTLPDGELQYEYGPQETAYSNWLIGKPLSKDDCRIYVLTLSTWYWYGYIYREPLTILSEKLFNQCFLSM